jgi:hypothetical protein
LEYPIRERDIMTITATYPDFKTVEVSVDKWAVDAAVESFYELGAILVQVKE